MKMEQTTNLKRSASQRSTLSAIVEWEGKYQKWMGLMNVFILLTSLFLIFFGIVLVLYYHMDKLDFGKHIKTILLPIQVTGLKKNEIFKHNFAYSFRIF